MHVCFVDDSDQDSLGNCADACLMASAAHGFIVEPDVVTNELALVFRLQL